MPYMLFEPELKRLGLSDRESAVYLAALGLGPSPVQDIARKAKIPRATTYLILETLMHRGLISRYSESKKTFFAAEKPEQLKRLLDQEEERIKEGRVVVDKLIPKLEAFMKTADDRPIVRYYTGLDGLRSIRSDLARQAKANQTWYAFSPIDHLRELFGEDEFSYAKQRIAKGGRSKTIFTTKSESVKNVFLATSRVQYSERKFIAPEQYTSSSGMSILGDHVAIGTFGEKLGGVIIESPSVAQMMRELFDLAWNRLD